MMVHPYPMDHPLWALVNMVIALLHIHKGTKDKLFEINSTLKVYFIEVVVKNVMFQLFGFTLREGLFSQHYLIVGLFHSWCHYLPQCLVLMLGFIIFLLVFK